MVFSFLNLAVCARVHPSVLLRVPFVCRLLLLLRPVLFLSCAGVFAAPVQ
jgi:hypothetical protein